MASCKNTRDITNYPYVEIPEYSVEDFYDLLFNKNNEIVYDSICNLINSPLLINFDSTDDNDVGKKIYTRIKELVNSKDDKIVAVSLKFLQINLNEKEKEQIIDTILKLKNSNLNINYERLVLLTQISDKSTKIENKFLENMLKNNSFVISKYSYLLVNKLENNEIRQQLIKKYSLLKEEYEKLLLLTAFQNNFTYDIFESFLAKELFNSNKKIKNYILTNIDNCIEKDKVVLWLEKNYNQLAKEDIGIIVSRNIYLGDNFSTDFFKLLIKNDYPLPDGFYQQLNQQVFYHPDKTSDQYKNLLELQNLVLQNTNIKDKYVKVKYLEVDKKLIEEHNRETKNYIANIQNILKKYKINQKKIDRYIDSMNYTLSSESVTNALKATEE